MTRSDKDDLPPCLIYIDKKGTWYHEGVEMIRREFIHLFYENMERDSKGRYVIKWGDQTCYVDVEDTAFVVRRVIYEHDDQNKNARFALVLSDDTEEALLPDSLFVGKDNVLYCRVKNHSFPARFNRAAYYQLAQYVEEDNNTYYLLLNGKKYDITQRQFQNV
ncbi:MAG: DUF1285 domain-containing protein [Thermodesulfobacteriota bacterium]|nr:DUF1285 domain-containing protein [Thermodesulfobacteriota bacterium]